MENDKMKKCPFCAEYIREEAIKCRYCGSRLDRKQGRTDMFQAEGHWRRVNEGKKIAGVCTGLARQLDAPVLVLPLRLFFILTTVFYGFGVVVYLLLWILMPAPEDSPAGKRAPAKGASSGRSRYDDDFAPGPEPSHDIAEECDDDGTGVEDGDWEEISIDDRKEKPAADDPDCGDSDDDTGDDDAPGGNAAGEEPDPARDRTAGPGPDRGVAERRTLRRTALGGLAVLGGLALFKTYALAVRHMTGIHLHDILGYALVTVVALFIIATLRQRRIRRRIGGMALDSH